MTAFLNFFFHFATTEFFCTLILVGVCIAIVKLIINLFRR